MKSINHLVGQFIEAKKHGLVLHIAIDEQHSSHNPYLTVIFRHGVLDDMVRKTLFDHIRCTYEDTHAEVAPSAPSMIFVYYTPNEYKIAV
jgi:hypothetical protein